MVLLVTHAGAAASAALKQPEEIVLVSAAGNQPRSLGQDIELVEENKRLLFSSHSHSRQELCYVRPSSGARCAQFPRARDKVHHYLRPKNFRDQQKGIAPNTEVQEVQYTFDLQLAQDLRSSLSAEGSKKMAVPEIKHDPGSKAASGGARCDRAPYESEQCPFSTNGTASIHSTVKGRPSVKFLVNNGSPSPLQTRVRCWFDTGRGGKRPVRAVSSRPSTRAAVLMQRSRLVPRFSN